MSYVLCSIFCLFISRASEAHILGPDWACLGLFLNRLGPFLARLGLFLNRLGHVWPRLGHLKTHQNLIWATKTTILPPNLTVFFLLPWTLLEKGKIPMTINHSHTRLCSRTRTLDHSGGIRWVSETLFKRNPVQST